MATVREGREGKGREGKGGKGRGRKEEKGGEGRMSVWVRREGRG